jgi:hypothetical protein
MPQSPAAQKKTKATTGRALTFDEIVGCEDRPVVDVEVPEWGGVVKVRGLSKGGRQRVRDIAFDAEGNFQAERWEDALIAEGLVEPELTIVQVGELRDKAAAAVERVVRAITEESKMGGGAVEAALAQFLPG